jgi:hypothetical protein
MNILSYTLIVPVFEAPFAKNPLELGAATTGLIIFAAEKPPEKNCCHGIS